MAKQSYTVREALSLMSAIEAAGGGELLVFYDADVSLKKEGYLPVTHIAIVDTSEDQLAPVNKGCLLSGPEQ